jgi:type IV pilus biogenesis protein CpaD/CtpE
MKPALRALVAAALLAAACASDEPSRGGAFDDSAGRAVVALRGDGYCTLDGERMPFDAMLLRLRVRARAFDDATLRRFVVRIEAPRDVTEATRAAVQRDLDRLVQELDVMDFAQVEYF